MLVHLQNILWPVLFEFPNAGLLAQSRFFPKRKGRLAAPFLLFVAPAKITTAAIVHSVFQMS
jgi:hypothetical protein